MKEYVKVDANGLPIDNQILRDDEVTEGFYPSWQQQEDKIWWKPKYDFTLNKWVESITEEEKNQIPQSKEPTEMEILKAENEMNAMAIMDLAKIVLGG